MQRTKTQQIRQDNQKRRAQQAATLASALRAVKASSADVSPTPTVDPEASPIVRLNQMLEQHEVQQQLEGQLETMAAQIETRDEFAIWLSALLESKSNTSRVLNWVLFNQSNGRRLLDWLPDDLMNGLTLYRASLR